MEIPIILNLTFWLTDNQIKKRGLAENSEEKTENEGPLTGSEHQELGRLRQERDKWKSSIKAAVHAALFAKDKEIVRNDLKDELYQFNLPDSTFEMIWKALRDKGLTKKAGRRKKTK